MKLRKISLSEDAARAAVHSGAEQVILIVPEEYAKRFAAGQPAPLLLVADSADSQTRKIADRARAVLANYGSGIAQRRLQVRGIDPLLALPVAVDEIDVATPAARAAALSEVCRVVERLSERGIEAIALNVDIEGAIELE